MGKTFLVTGATGFVGRHLLEALKAGSDQDGTPMPLALVREAQSWTRYDWTRALGGVELIEGSVTDPAAWEDDRRLRDVGGIFHLAGVVRHSRRAPSDMYETNLKGTLQMVRLAHRYRCRMIFISTSGTVGCFDSPEEWADEESPYCEKTVSSWPYYDSKIRAEKEARKLAQELGVELIIVRPPILLGPGDHRLRVSGHILRLLRGKLPFIVRGGIHFVDIRDAVQFLIRAMIDPQPRPVYHLVGTVWTIDDFFRTAAEIGGVSPPRFHLPAPLARLAAGLTARIDTVLRKKSHPTLPDPVVFEMASKHWNVRSRYAHELGFTNRLARETIGDTIEWLREHHEELNRNFIAPGRAWSRRRGTGENPAWSKP